MSHVDFHKFFKKKKDLIGFAVCAIGIGILLALIVPYIGWVIFSALALVGLGVFLLRS